MLMLAFSEFNSRLSPEMSGEDTFGENLESQAVEKT